MNTPSPCLYKQCLNYICNNLNLLCELSPNGKLEFKDKSFMFNHIVSEDLLEHLADYNQLNDLTLNLFAHNNQTSLKSVRLKNVSCSKDSFKLFLKKHQLTELIINNINLLDDNPLLGQSDLVVLKCSKNASMLNNLIDGLNDWSFQHLKHLNLARNGALFSSILFDIKSFKNLVKLNVSLTAFNNHSFDIVTQELSCLESLDMSCTRVGDFIPLTRLKHQLKSLYMYNMRAPLNDDIIPIICCLTKLHNLDISCDVSTQIFGCTLSVFDVNLFIEELCKAKLEELNYLDISGKTEIKIESLK